jgi:hypothetical protein
MIMGPARSSGFIQDVFTKEEVADIIKAGSLQKGKYQLDIAPDGSVKMSSVQARWVQKADFMDS